MTSLKLTKDQLPIFMEMLHQTRSDELTCEEWLDRVGAYAEAMAAGLPAPPGTELVEHHLALCWECREEFDALLAALSAEPS